MSDTPRTETILREIAAHCEEKGWVAYDVDAYSAGQLQMFAHTLERELAEAHAVELASGEIRRALDAENAKLREAINLAVATEGEREMQAILVEAQETWRRDK